MSDPNNAGSRETASVYQRAHTLIDTGHPREARALIAPALAADPDDYRALRCVARSYIRENTVSGGLRAVVAATSMVRLRPEEPLAWMLLSHSHTKASNHREARRTARVAQSLGPDIGAAHAQVGYADVAASKISRHTWKSVKQGVELEPDTVFTRFQLARVGNATGRYRLAEREYTAVLRIDRNAADAEGNLLLVRISRGHPGESARRLLLLLGTRPSDRFLNGLIAFPYAVTMVRFLRLLWATSGLIFALVAFGVGIFGLPAVYSPFVVHFFGALALVLDTVAIGATLDRFRREAGDRLSSYWSAIMKPRRRIWRAAVNVIVFALLVAALCTPPAVSLWLSAATLVGVTLLRWTYNAFISIRARRRRRRRLTQALRAVHGPAE